jgi:hypothetical protein
VLVLLPVAGVLGWFIATGGGPLANARTSPGAESVRILILCLGGLVLVTLTSIGGTPGHPGLRARPPGSPNGRPRVSLNAVIAIVLGPRPKPARARGQ